MPQNLNAQKRYVILNECFKKGDKYYFMEDLREETAKATPDGRRPSSSTISHDIMAMKSGELGYEAPIVYSKEEGYRYSNPQFSIHQQPLNLTVIKQMGDALSLLYDLSSDLKILAFNNIITEVSNKLNVQLDLNDPIIKFEKSSNTNAFWCFNDLYQAIKDKKCLMVTFQHFDNDPVQHILSPYFLKEYNNRWYLFGFDHNKNSIVHLSLDRIKYIKNSLVVYNESDKTSMDQWFNHLYGVTIFDGTSPVVIEFLATEQLSHYLVTKPIHPTQKLLQKKGEKGWLKFSLEVYINYEVTSRLLSFGEELVITSPSYLVQEIKEKLILWQELYNGFSS